jgi:hypothetical protein
MKEYMSYYIENITEIDHDFVMNGQWDVIKFNLKLNPQKLQDYLNELKTTHKQQEFNFKEHTDVLNEYTHNRVQNENRVSNYVGDVTGWTLVWPIERDDPIPSQVHIDKKQFPELEKYNLYHDGKLMNRFNYGYMTTLMEQLTIKSFRQTIVTKHPKGLVTLTHVDGERKKLHIPLQTNPNAIFHFGENGEREYHFEVGNMYLINPAIPHGTYNHGDDRYHMISRIDFDYMNTVLSMSGTID